MSMAINESRYKEIISELKGKATLVAVSKTKPVEDIKDLYDLGQRDFGENYVQELADKQPLLPSDIRWHFIGHLQSNKVKYIAPFVHLIHGVDSLKLLQEINKQAAKSNRVIDCLLQIHIAKEETKFGLDEKELNDLISQFGNWEMKNVRVAGLMGMASFSDDMDLVRSEFKFLKTLFDKFNIQYSAFSILSMGMSSDYKIAVEEGSTMVRIGSLIFGERNYNQ
ncbi:MAG: YggS family pyridoxal phosphate-dependent enzyme [Sphingobacteriales bacterium]